MIIFATRSARHLVDTIHLPITPYTVTTFSDGELSLALDLPVPHEKIWIIASTQPPAENSVELFFLLDALTRAGARDINLLCPYFGYARHVPTSIGYAHGAHLWCTFLRQFPLKSVFIMHAHAEPIMQTFLPFTNLVDLDFFCAKARDYDAIAAPDAGAASLARTIAQQSNKELILLRKRRPEQEYATIESINGNAQGRRILLVDDIVSTGRTLIEAANALKTAGALDIAAAATHGIFSNGAHERLAESFLHTIHVTNTLNQIPHPKVTVHNAGTLIERVIQNKSL